jgi:hypothetical protein
MAKEKAAVYAASKRFNVYGPSAAEVYRKLTYACCGYFFSILF